MSERSQHPLVRADARRVEFGYTHPLNPDSEIRGVSLSAQAGMERVGFYKSDYIAPIVINDNMTMAGEVLGQVSMPAEVWFSADHNMTFLMVRSGPVGGMRKFADELVAFAMSTEFANVVLLTATMSPVSRERDSNR